MPQTANKHALGEPRPLPDPAAVPPENEASDAEIMERPKDRRARPRRPAAGDVPVSIDVRCL